MARECYFAIVKGKQKARKTFTVSSDNLAEQKQNKVKTIKGMANVKINKHGKTTKVGA